MPMKRMSLKPDGYVRFREPWPVRLMTEMGRIADRLQVGLFC